VSSWTVTLCLDDHEPVVLAEGLAEQAAFRRAHVEIAEGFHGPISHSETNIPGLARICFEGGYVEVRRQA
jgi:hypothetical protein